MDLVFIHLDEVFYQLIPVGVSMFVYIDFALAEKSSAHCESSVVTWKTKPCSLQNTVYLLPQNGS